MTATQIGERFIEALSSRDFDGMRRILSPDVRFRALTPPGTIEKHGDGVVTALFEEWFGPLASFEKLCSGAEPMIDRLHFWYRFRELREPDGDPEVVEQHVFADVVDGRLATIDLLCSGDRTAA